MKILVTGCAGFIGFHLTRKLLECGHRVTGIDDLNDYYDPELKRARLAQFGVDAAKLDPESPAVQSGSFTFIYIGIEDKEQFDIFTADEDFDVVVHLAAQAGVRYSMENPQAYVTSNLQGFFNVMEYCRANPKCRFVFASSSSVYGNNDQVPYKETERTDFPVSFYGATKKAGEVLAASYASLYGIDTVGLRFFTVYGPWGRPDMAPFIFTKAILKGEPIDVFNHGEMWRDFTYVDDIVAGVLRVVESAPATREAYQSDNFRIYNIGNSKPVKLDDFIATVERVAGRKAHRHARPMQPGDVLRTWADTTLLGRDFGYKPGTPLEKGLSEFVKWYTDFYN